MADDPYATAKANLRDNVKTLITMFGGVTAVLLAGAPFSGYSGMEQFGTPWWIATVALLVAFGLLGWAVRRLLFILRPDSTSIRVLIDPGHDPELIAVRDKFQEEQQNLLPQTPPGQLQINSVQELINAEGIAWNDYIAARDAAQNENDRLIVADFKEAYDGYHANLQYINSWVQFARLHERVTVGLDKVMLIGIGAILAIALFVIAASGSKKPEMLPSPSVYVVEPSSLTLPQPQEAPLPVLAPVLFATNKADLTAEAVIRIDAARAYLRTHARTGVLIFANTDTMGSAQLNAGLAARRANRVASLLRTEGGISASRVFVTPLAKSDLPRLTEQKTESQDNRSVEMILIPLPLRK